MNVKDLIRLLDEVDEEMLVMSPEGKEVCSVTVFIGGIKGEPCVWLE